MCKEKASVILDEYNSPFIISCWKIKRKKSMQLFFDGKKKLSSKNYPNVVGKKIEKKLACCINLTKYVSDICPFLVVNSNFT